MKTLYGNRRRSRAPLHKLLLAELEPARGSNRRELSEASRLLRLAMEHELTERQRTCLELYYLENLTMQEIADRLGTTRGNVSKRIKKAVERLRRALRYSEPGLKFLSDRKDS